MMGLFILFAKVMERERKNDDFSFFKQLLRIYPESFVSLQIVFNAGIMGNIKIVKGVFDTALESQSHHSLERRHQAQCEKQEERHQEECNYSRSVSVSNL